MSSCLSFFMFFCCTPFIGDHIPFLTTRVGVIASCLQCRSQDFEKEERLSVNKTVRFSKVLFDVLFLLDDFTYRTTNVTFLLH